MSHSQMEILQNFQIQKTSLREIDEILSNIIRKPQRDPLAGAVHIFDALLTSFGMALEIIKQHVGKFEYILSCNVVFIRV